jgi:THO complex subunit 2
VNKLTFRSAPPVAPTDKDDKDKPFAAHPPPAGPRATRSTGSVPPPAPATSNGNGPSDKIVAPTGPSRTAPNTTLPQRPGQQAQSMGPPKALTADEERAAARARRFGSLVSDSMPIRGSASPAQSPAPSPRGKEGSPMAPPSTPGVKKEDEARPKSPPLPPSRKSSPGTKRRSNSIESRTSERSRRDHRDRDRGGRDDRRKDSRATTPDTKVEEKGGDKDRKKQEDLLQARHDKLAGAEERRSSGSRKEKETEKERADRKAREKEEKAAKEKDEAGGKRKRDEAVSFVYLL